MGTTISRNTVKQFVIALVKMRANNRNVYAKHSEIDFSEYPSILIGGKVELSADVQGNWIATESGVENKFNPTIPTGIELFLAQYEEAEVVEAIDNFNASTTALFIAYELE